MTSRCILHGNCIYKLCHGHHFHFLFYFSMGCQTVEKDPLWLSFLTGGFPITRAKIEPGCKPGDNYVSKVNRWIFHYQNSSNEDVQRAVIVKESYEADSVPCQIMDCTAMFANEVTFYKKVIPLLMKRDLNIIPECYYAEPGCLVLEDMATQGFTMADRRVGLGLEECRLVMKALAKFHAQSFLLKTTSPTLWTSCSSLSQETVFCERFENQTVDVLWNNSMWCAAESLRMSTDPRLAQLAEKLHANIGGKVLKTLRQLTVCENQVFTVINHGDLWSNNLVFRYDDDKRPTSVCLLDFQATRHSSCVLDILHLMCTSAKTGILAANFESLIRIYYANLGEIVGRLPFDFEKLLKELKSNILFGLLLGFMMIPCATAETEPLASYEKTYLESSEARQRQLASLGPECNRRIRSMMLDLLEIGYLTISSF